MELEYIGSCYENKVGFLAFGEWARNKELEMSFANYIRYCKYLVKMCLSDRDFELLDIY